MNEALFNFLSWINSWVGNWGWAMVVFTVLIRLVLTPIDIRSRAGMRKTQLIQPKLNELQKKYANDKEKLNQKTAELYKKEGVNPMSSCLPLLLTWPILIIVFSAMRTAANQELLGQVTEILNNQSPTMEPWLWIKNLWMPDSLFSPAMPNLNTLRQIPVDMWKNWYGGLGESLPLLMQNLGLTPESFDSSNLQATLQTLVDAMKGNAEYANAIATKDGWTFNLILTQLTLVNGYNGYMILPILSAVTQVIMTKITTAQQQTQGAPANDQAAATSKMMNWFFPLFSLYICFGYSSAFALYWVTGNLAMMVQTVIINKVLDNKDKKAKIAGEGTVK